MASLSASTSRTVVRATNNSSKPVIRVSRPFAASTAAPRRIAVQLLHERCAGKASATQAYSFLNNSKREDFSSDDVDDYFCTGGFLADEGDYDRMWKLLEQYQPCDVLLILAATANDTSKVQELIRCGANPQVKNVDGRTLLELATSPATIAVLKA